MTPRRRLRSPRSLAAAGFLWLLLGGSGCESVGSTMIGSLLGIDADYTYRNDYRHTEATETRRWTLQYTEHLQLTSDLPGTHAVVNGEDLGPCPVTTVRSPRPVGIDETGFYPAHDVYKVKYKKLDNGRRRFVSDEYLRTQRAPGPTRWAGHRAVTADLSPLTVEWVRGGQVLGTTVVAPTSGNFTLRTASDAVDPVLVAALRNLEWNRPATDPAVPGEAHGHRPLHWPPTPETPEESESTPSSAATTP